MTTHAYPSSKVGLWDLKVAAAVTPSWLFALRFAGVFAAVSVALFSALYVVFPYLFGLDLVSKYAEALAATLGIALRKLGTHVAQSGAALIAPGYSVIVVDDCTGIVELILFVSAVLAYPGPSWHWRSKGLLIGGAGIVIVNFGRIVGLYYIGAWMPEFLGVFHLYIGSGLFLLLTLGFFLLWLEGEENALQKG